MGLIQSILLLQATFSIFGILGALFVFLLLIIIILAAYAIREQIPDPIAKPPVQQASTKKSIHDVLEDRSVERVKPIDIVARKPRPSDVPFASMARSTSTAQHPIPGVSSALSSVKESDSSHEGQVKALRGGEFIGSRMRYKVKVLNDSPFTITDVTIYLLSYPHQALKLVGDDDEFFAKIEPGGFRSPCFDFMPTQDCVRGDIVAGISFMDSRGRAHTLTTKPFVIRSVCDLLIPEQLSPEDFTLKLKKLEHGEITLKVEEWTPEEMYEKALKIVDDSNFFEIESNIENSEGVIFGRIQGSAKGKYTGKSVGVEITITGPTRKKGASCNIKVSGEDEAMILPAIDDLRERLSAWLCPMCGSPLTLANVEDLKKGKTICCPFCSVTIGR
ncbi:MAG: hypothetical protein JW779_02570 [Candidatus Thorarchaeota archaeon]|nr:hypothetical protein [Candidatus Thorarchaeota archaeon]